MRIISGKFKGKRIIAPKKLPVRPTTDMAKEGLFNILNHQYYFEELSVVDLFAGTGNISYEFASRGVPELTAVDGHAGCVQFISKTAKELNAPITPIKADVFKFLERHSDPKDLFFADPPYDFEKEQLLKIVALIFENNLLREDGVCILEHRPQIDLSDAQFFGEKRKYGSSVFSFFYNKAS